MNLLYHKLVSLILCSSKSSLRNPVFILSPPRSGSTLLFEMLCQFSEFMHFDYESDFIWWDCFPYHTMVSPSDYIGRELATCENVRTLRNKTCEALAKKYGLAFHSMSRNHRFLDKTIANCFHLDFLIKAFPDAQFVILFRDPRDTISSMIEGWPYLERFGKAQLSPILQTVENRSISHWTYPAPPEWHSVVTRTLPEICAWSWQQHVEQILTFFSIHPTIEHISIRYEILNKDPLSIIAQLSSFLKLDLAKVDHQKISKPSLSATTVSKPEPEKWRKRHYDDIVSILPMLLKIATDIGYDLTATQEYPG